jgi:hypothetical protein
LQNARNNPVILPREPGSNGTPEVMSTSYTTIYFLAIYLSTDYLTYLERESEKANMAKG